MEHIKDKRRIAVALRKGGMTYREIADTLKINRQTAWNYVHTDLDDPTLRRTAIKKQTLHHFIVQFKKENDGNSPTLEEMATAVGRSRATIRRYLDDLEQEGHIRLIDRGDVPHGKFLRIIVINGMWVHNEDGEDEREEDTGRDYQS